MQPNVIIIPFIKDWFYLIKRIQSTVKTFLQNWRDRVGNNMEIELNYVEDIPVEKSGKFRLVKNNIKDLI